MKYQRRLYRAEFVRRRTAIEAAQRYADYLDSSSIFARWWVGAELPSLQAKRRAWWQAHRLAHYAESQMEPVARRGELRRLYREVRTARAAMMSKAAGEPHERSTK